jgi:hypothetical protein
MVAVHAMQLEPQRLIQCLFKLQIVLQELKEDNPIVTEPQRLKV